MSRRDRSGGQSIGSPNAIDPRSGFKVKLGDLVRQWDGELVHRRFADKRHPQDFVRARVENIALPVSRPEAPDRFNLGPLLTEDENWIYAEDGQILMAEGAVIVL